MLDASTVPTEEENLRRECSIPEEALLVLYIGNLEPYQGIDLLMEGFAAAAQTNSTAQLVIIGGALAHIENYKKKAQQLQIADRVHLTGSAPCLTAERLFASG